MANTMRLGLTTAGSIPGLSIRQTVDPSYGNSPKPSLIAASDHATADRGRKRWGLDYFTDMYRFLRWSVILHPKAPAPAMISDDRKNIFRGLTPSFISSFNFISCSSQYIYMQIRDMVINEITSEMTLDTLIIYRVFGKTLVSHVPAERRITGIRAAI